MEKKGKKSKSLRKAVDKFNEENDMFTTVQDKEFSKRRDSKRRRKQEINMDRRLQLYNKLYLPTLGCLVVGFVFSIGSNVRGLSEKTFLWKHREIFYILGPVLLIVGVGLLLVSIALVTNRREKVTRLVAIRKSIKSDSKKNTSASLHSSINSSDNMCHSIEDLEEFEQSFTLLSTNEKHSNRKLSSSNSQVSFSEEVRVHEIKDMQLMIENQGQQKEKPPIISAKCVKSPTSTALPYRPESVSFRLLEGVITAQKSVMKNRDRTLAKYKSQLHVKQTGNSNFLFQEFIPSSRHHNNTTSKTNKATLRAMNKLRVFRTFQSGVNVRKDTSNKDQEHIPLSQENVQSECGVSNIGTDLQTGSPDTDKLIQRPKIPMKSGEKEPAESKKSKEVLVYSSQSILHNKNSGDSSNIQSCAEIKILIHSPENNSDINVFGTSEQELRGFC